MSRVRSARPDIDRAITGQHDPLKNRARLGWPIQAK